MMCPAGGDLWLTTIMHHRSPVSQPQAAVWALGSFGRGLARSWTLSTVGRLLAAGMQRPEQTVRQRRRAWEDDAARKRGGRVEINGPPLGGEPVVLTGDVAIAGAHTGRFQIKVAGQGTQVFGTVITTRDGRTLRTQLGQWTPTSPFIAPAILPNGADADGIDP